MDIDLATLPVQQLLTLDRQILNELRRRQIVRTGNSPVGDWAELLVAKAFGGELAPNSEKSYDVLTPDNQRLQVKARMLDPTKVGSNTLSAIRTWDFDQLVVVLFDPDTFTVSSASSVPTASAQPHAKHSAHTNAWILRPTPDLMALGDDITNKLTHIAAAL